MLLSSSDTITLLVKCIILGDISYGRKLIVLLFMFMLTACTNSNTNTETTDSLSTENVIAEISAKEEIEYPIIIETIANAIEFAYQHEGVFWIYTGGKFGFLK